MIVADVVLYCEKFITIIGMHCIRWWSRGPWWWTSWWTWILQWRWIWWTWRLSRSEL